MSEVKILRSLSGAKSTKLSLSVVSSIPKAPFSTPKRAKNLSSLGAKTRPQFTERSTCFRFYCERSDMSSRPQPMLVYPRSTSGSALPPSHSKGSFTPVFIVLAIIAVMAVIACCVGEVCARRYLRPRARKDRAFPYRSDMEEGHPMGAPVAAEPGPKSAEVSSAVGGAKP